MKFVIDRNAWLRGEGEDSSYLYRNLDGRMCCLGQIGLQCGISISDMTHVCTPCETSQYSKFPDVLWQNRSTSDETPCIESTSFANQMMVINDAEYITDKQRETKLIEEAAKRGIELEFVDGETTS